MADSGLGTVTPEPQSGSGSDSERQTPQEGCNKEGCDRGLRETIPCKKKKPSYMDLYLADRDCGI